MEEPRKLKVGDLVEHKVNGAVGRVESVWPDGKHSYIYVKCTLRSLDGLEDKFSFISDTPPVPTSEVCLEMRRSMLENAVSSLYSSYRRSPPIAKFYDSIFTGINPNKWFWGSLACSAKNPRTISYAPSKEFVDNDKRRRGCSWNKFLSTRAVEYGLELVTEDIDTIACFMGGYFATSYSIDFEILSGQDVIETYCDKEFGSCMWNDRSYLEFYAINPQSVSILRCIQNGNLCARGLVWKTNCGATVLDRVYPTDNGPHYNTMIGYAKSQGWDYRVRSGDNLFASGRRDYFVDMDTSPDNYFPFIDSFQFTDDEPTGSMVTLNTERGFINFSSTEGSWMGKIPKPCVSCGEQLQSCESIYVGSTDTWVTYCRSCRDRLVRQLVYEIRGPRTTRYPRGFGNSRYFSEWFPINECSNCNRCGRTTLSIHNAGTHCLACETDAEYLTRMGVDTQAEITTNEPVATSTTWTTQAESILFDSGQLQNFVQSQEAILPSNLSDCTLWGRNGTFPFLDCDCPACGEARGRLLSQPGFLPPNF